jgi:glycosyltransferase involved in cell wall biosynthesis
MTSVWELVIPCRDEAESLPGLLAGVPAGCRVIVVDNGSTDRTAAVASSLGATVVHAPVPGYGAAVTAGVAAATADVVAFMDGDGSLDAADLARLVASVVRGEADLATGRRRPVGRKAWPWHARAGNAVVLWWLGWRTGLRLHDIPAMRVCRREALLALGTPDQRFGYPVDLLVRAARAGWVVAEHDVPYRPRTGGRSKVSGSLAGSARAARDFVRVLP